MVYSKNRNLIEFTFLIIFDVYLFNQGFEQWNKERLKVLKTSVYTEVYPSYDVPNSEIFGPITGLLV